MQQPPYLLFCLQQALNFRPGQRALAIVQQVLQLQHSRQQQWADGALALVHRTSRKRCTVRPVYGAELRKVGASLTCHACRRE